MLPEVDFSFIAREVKARSGLVLTADKAYLLETRLAPIARKEGLAGINELLALARSRRDDKLIWQITDALTTNETFFFRDKTPFDIFRERIIPEMQRRKTTRMRIWCAAASTGQEPYSIAMIMDDLRSKGISIDAEIIATDISERVLEKAKAGLYSQFEVQRGLPVQMLVKYFEKQGDLWRISDRMRAAVRFQRHNLLEDPRGFGKFDVVFCRNVLIYFEPEAKKASLERIATVTQDNGFLLLGAAETVMGITDAFNSTPEQRSLYQRSTGWRKAA